MRKNTKKVNNSHMNDSKIKVEPVKECLQSSHLPNEETIKAIMDIENGVGLIRAENLDDLFEKLGI